MTIIIYYYFCNKRWSALICRSIFIISFGYLNYIVVPPAAASKKRRRTPKNLEPELLVVWWPQHFRTPFEAEMLFTLCDVILKFIQFNFFVVFYSRTIIHLSSSRITNIRRINKKHRYSTSIGIIFAVWSRRPRNEKKSTIIQIH